MLLAKLELDVNSLRCESVTSSDLNTLELVPCGSADFDQLVDLKGLFRNFPGQVKSKFLPGSRIPSKVKFRFQVATLSFAQVSMSPSCQSLVHRQNVLAVLEE